MCIYKCTHTCKYVVQTNLYKAGVGGWLTSLHKNAKSSILKHFNSILHLYYVYESVEVFQNNGWEVFQIFFLRH